MSNKPDATSTAGLAVIVILSSSGWGIAGFGRPLAAVRLALEVQRGDPGQLQVGGVVHGIGDDEILVAVGFGVDIPVLRKGSPIAVRHAVLPQIAWPEIRRYRLHRTRAGSA